MRVTLGFPPSIRLPNSVYVSLPSLAGALGRAGHRVRCVDLNLESAQRFLTEDRVERYLRIARDRGAVLTEIEPVLRRSPDSIRLLRDPARSFDQEKFRTAFWTVGDALSFFYHLDPIVSPFRERFAADMIELQESDPWTPQRDLYDEGLLERRRPSLHVSLGGPLLNVHPERWIDGGWIFRWVDSLCLGDGETAIGELVEAIERRRGLDEVRNLVGRDAGGSVRRNTPTPYLEDLDELAPPDFRAVDMSRFLTPEPLFPLKTSRGCYWGKCTFCCIGWRENYRMASPEILRRNARLLARSYGARYVNVIDSTIPPASARHLAEVVRDEGLGLYWSAGFKSAKHLLDRDYVRRLGEGGCRSAQMRLESANQDILDLMEKGFELADVPRILDNFREADISTELLWFIGFPRETRADVRRTIEFLHAHRHRFGLSAFVGDYQLHPDTEVFARPRDFGVTIRGQENGYVRYDVDRGLTQEEVGTLKRLLAPTNNRTLMCNGSYLLHLVQSGLEDRGLARPLNVAPEAVELLERARA
jgi:radical SAM superfamily enzyme YgiQ (UPF0313 family)